MLPKERFEQLRTCKVPSGGVFGTSGVGVAVVVVGATVVVVVEELVVVVDEVGGAMVDGIDDVDCPDAMGETTRGIVVAGTVVDVVLVDVVADSIVVDVAGAGTESEGLGESSVTSGVVGGTCPSSAASLGAEVTETISPVVELPLTRMNPPRTMRAPAAAPIIHKAARRPRRPVA